MNRKKTGFLLLLFAFSCTLTKTRTIKEPAGYLNDLSIFFYPMHVNKKDTTHQLLLSGTDTIISLDTVSSLRKDSSYYLVLELNYKNEKKMGEYDIFDKDKRRLGSRTVLLLRTY